MMLFVYEICPHCMDQLIERKQPMEDDDSVNYCPRCGKKLVMACFGEQRIDDTTYKIILNDASLTDYMNKKQRFIERLMKMGNLTLDQAIEKYRTKNCLIFEGNVSKAYVNIGLLEAFTPDIHYTVVPNFPFESLVNPFVSICPTCGSDTVHKTVDVDVPPNYVHDGFYCEKCNEWVMFTAIPKEEDMLML